MPTVSAMTHDWNRRRQIITLSPTASQKSQREGILPAEVIYVPSCFHQFAWSTPVYRQLMYTISRFLANWKHCKLTGRSDWQCKCSVYLWRFVSKILLPEVIAAKKRSCPQPRHLNYTQSRNQDRNAGYQRWNTWALAGNGVQPTKSLGICLSVGCQSRIFWSGCSVRFQNVPEISERRFHYMWKERGIID